MDCSKDKFVFFPPKFNSKPKLGGNVIIDKYLRKLQNEIENEFKLQLILNERKKQSYIVSNVHFD